MLYKNETSILMHESLVVYTSDTYTHGHIHTYEVLHKSAFQKVVLQVIYNALD